MTIWPFLASIGAVLSGSGSGLLLVFACLTPLFVSAFVWLYIFMNAGWTGFGFAASSVVLAFPVIGPIFALAWLIFSVGMSELYGFAPDEEESWRKHLPAAFFVVWAVGGIAYGIYLKFFS